LHESLLSRIDPVLFIIGVPETDAALANHEFPAPVTRTS
jgi:hypothetical protein